MKRDSLALGCILGIFAPFLGMLIYYFWKFYPLSLRDFFNAFVIQKTLITGMVSFSLIANAVLFTIYINTQRDKTARGIFFVTCIYAIAAIIMKMVL